MVVMIAHIPYCSGPNKRRVKGVMRRDAIAVAPLARTLQAVPRTTVVSTPEVGEKSAFAGMIAGETTVWESATLSCPKRRCRKDSDDAISIQFCLSQFIR